MPHHLVVRLPDGRDAWIDYREPIAARRKGTADRIMSALADADPKHPPAPADLAQVAAWLDGNAEQSGRCRAFCQLQLADCGHLEAP